MLELIGILGGIVLPPIVGYVVDRWKYSRDIFRHGSKLLPALKNETARQLAERAILIANQKEIERATEQLSKQMAESQVRLSAIESGNANIGSLPPREHK